MSILKLPKEFHPDFQNPRVKPVGEVGVDWEHPLARGLISYLFLDSTNDLVRHQNITNNGSLRTINGYSFSSSSLEHSGWLALSDYQNITAVVKAKPNNVSASSQLFSAREDSTSNSRLYIFSEAGGNLRFYVGNTYAGGGSISAGVGTLLSVERDGSNAFGYQDGVQVATGSGHTFTTGSADNFLKLGQYSAGTSDPYDGNIEFSGIWDRKLSALEHKTLADNPYAFLKPKQPLYLFTADGVAPSGFQSAWAQGNNHLYGGM